MPKYRLHDGKKGSAIGIRITPRATRNEVAEIRSDGTIRIRLITKKADDSANSTLLEFLAKILGVSASRLEVVAGETGADKLVSILDLDTETAHKRIIAHLGKE